MKVLNNSPNNAGSDSREQPKSFCYDTALPSHLFQASPFHWSTGKEIRRYQRWGSARLRDQLTVSETNQ